MGEKKNNPHQPKRGVIEKKKDIIKLKKHNQKKKILRGWQSGLSGRDSA
jgi:hypothetical protein